MNTREISIYAFALQLAARIVVPLLVGVAGGLWLDTRLHTRPWALLICLGAAFFLTMISLYRQAKQAIANLPPEIRHPQKK